MIFRPYQNKLVDSLAKLLSKLKRIVGQLATGGGKTVIFSGIAKRYIEKNPGKAVLILVHRDELLKQTRKTAFNSFNLECQPITKGMKYIPHADVYVGMVESTWRRIVKLNPNIGLVIVDECHRLEFAKFYSHFKDEIFIIGFSATPLSANKKKPLKNYFDDIVCGADIPELIADGFLCQNITYSPKEIVDRKELMVKKGQDDFDLTIMGEKYSSPKYINNTVQAYEKWAKGTKTLIFNVNIEHSRAVTSAFNLAGYNVKHLDSTMNDTERKRILHWYHVTADAILCNIGITTMGFDEPTVETVMVNRATQSMPLWIQMCGRGSRPTPTKSAFTIIDMGGNGLVHGDWNQTRDWYEIFHNPPKPGKDTAAPVKSCPNCDAIIPAASRVCPFCGFKYSEAEKNIEAELYDFVVITKDIDVAEVMKQHSAKKDYYAFFKIGKELAAEAKKTIPKMCDDYANFILLRYHDLAREWIKLYSDKIGKRKAYNKWHQANAKMTLFKELGEHYPDWKTELINQAEDEFGNASAIKRPFFVS